MHPNVQKNAAATIDIKATHMIKHNIDPDGELLFAPEAGDSGVLLDLLLLLFAAAFLLSDR